MWSCDHILVGYSSSFMREVIISEIIYGFVQKTDVEGWSWFNVNNLGLVLGMTLKFHSCVGKRWKLNSKSVEGSWKRGFLHSPPPPILNRVKNDLADSHPVKTIKKEKYMFHYLIVCSLELTCTVTFIILENTFGNIKINCFYLRRNRVGEIALMSLHVCRCSTSVSVRL